MIKAIIFDMDGLLIDSEPLWQKAEIKVFKKVNIHLNKELCEETKGMKIDSVIDYWHSKYPWSNFSKKDIENEIMKEVISLVKSEGKSMEGVEYILNFVKNKNLKIALASSSNMALINEVIIKLNLKNYFDLVYSAEYEEHGKPHPGVYLTTARKLGVTPFECLAIEDSFNGLLSAKAASMKCISVPEKNDFVNNKFLIADEILPSLNDFDDRVWKRINN